MTTGTQQLRDFSDWLDRRYPASVSMGVRAAADYIDAQAAEIERRRDALEWYQEKSKAMAGAAISGDRQAMINLMQEIAVDYGKRARAALSGEGK